ncbi:MAG: hypothetical protein PHV30_04520 [Candidatus Margulisbacteria bacterium]|nr:hypothetical protein [Candidatus Margulisiibacteriota bacterium]
MKKLIYMFILIAFSSTMLMANPFMTLQPVKSSHVPAISDNQMLSMINLAQKHLKEELVVLSKKIKTVSSPKFWIILLAVSFIYGVIHAVGPGHGKIVAASYFINTTSRFYHPLIYGISFALLHSLSAIILTFVIYFILKLPLMSSFSSTGDMALVISYGLLLLIGFLMLVKAFKKQNDEQEFNLTRLLSVSAISGMVPCPGALVILAFSIALESLMVGISSVIFMALGMAVTLSLVGIVVSFGKDSVLTKMFREKPVYLKAQRVLSVLGALLIIVISGLFLLATIS